MAAIVIGGVVVNAATGKGTGPVGVECWGQGLLSPFAAVTTTASGEFKVPIGEQKDVITSFGDRARILEFRISRDGLAIPIKDGGTLAVNSLTLKAVIKVEIAIAPPAPTPPAPLPPPLDPNTQGPFRAHGFVLQADGVPLSGAVVQAFDQDMRSRDALGSALTDDSGAYAIPYGEQQFAEAEADTADLVLEVLSDQGAPIKLARVVPYIDGRASAIAGPIFNAPPDVRVDLLVEVQQRKGLSEFEFLVALLEPLMQGISAANLTEDDVAFLAGDTTIEARFIRMFAVGSKLAHDLELPAPVFYGLAREGVALDLHLLARYGADAFQQVLRQALQDNVIPNSLGDSLKDLVASLVKAIAAKALGTPVASGVPALSAVLSAATAESGDQDKFLAMYAAHEGPPEEFWKWMRTQKTLPPELIDRIQTTLQLTVLTRGNVALAQQISALQQQRKMTTLRDLAKLDADEWLKVLAQGAAAVPADIEGDSDDAKRRNYARSLEAEVDQAFPTAAIARRMTKEAAPRNADVLTFLDQNSDFEFDRTHVATYLASKPNALEGAKDQNAAIARLKQLQRLFTVTPHYSEISVLEGAGMDSARTVARMGPTAFVQRFGERLGDAARARELYDRSARIASIAASLFVKFAPAVNAVNFHATRRPS